MNGEDRPTDPESLEEPEYPEIEPWINDTWAKLAFDAQSLKVWEHQLKQRDLWAPFPTPAFYDYLARLEATAAVTRRLVEWLYLEPPQRRKDRVRAIMLIDREEARVAWGEFANTERTERAQTIFAALSQEAAHYTRDRFDPNHRLWEYVDFVREGLSRFEELSRSSFQFSDEIMRRRGLTTQWPHERPNK
jgi:hypothetical protein